MFSVAYKPQTVKNTSRASHMGVFEVTLVHLQHWPGRVAGSATALHKSARLRSPNSCVESAHGK